ncbi:MAG TPA: GTPase Era [Thermoanaerobacterales bacterium]|nr:GTPase Era [Thermoanaerobacterales bacterium]
MLKNYKSGFVSILGRTNVGKSTLLNSLIKEKVAIISQRPQTTRNVVRGILTEKDYQIIFIDTPGIHKPKHKLGKHMVNMAMRSLDEVDAVLFITDGTYIGPGDRYIIEAIENIKAPIILLLNKMDLMTKSEIDSAIEEFSKTMNFYNIIPISAINKDNLDKVLATIIQIIPHGPQYYPSEMYTDQPERLIIAELIREKALQSLREEIPHGVAIDVEKMLEKPDEEITYIGVTIYCEKESHKGIIIGKNGQMLKHIGKLARLEIEEFLGTNIFLDIWVKVNKDWRNKEGFFRNLEYR